MIVYFVELERSDEAYFREALPGHDVRFVERLDEVKADAEILSIFINFPVHESFLAAHPKLRFIATRSSASDHADVEACRRHGVLVSTVPKFGDRTVAEHAFALILALSRRLREIMAFTQESPSAYQRFSYSAARGFDLTGKTLGIVGMGRIGRIVLKLAQAFQMEVIAYDPMEMPEAEAREGGFRWVSLDDLLAEAHIVSLHVRLSKQTYHLLDREAFSRCRPGVLIINTARGRLIDTEALAEALESGQVGGAGLDVLEQEQVLRASASQIITSQILEHLRAEGAPSDNPPADRLRSLQQIVSSDALLMRRNVVFTPHVAFNSVEAIDRLYEGTLKNLLGFLSGKPVNVAEADPDALPQLERQG